MQLVRMISNLQVAIGCNWLPIICHIIINQLRTTTVKLMLGVNGSWTGKRLCKVIYQKRHETLAFITISDMISLNDYLYHSLKCLQWHCLQRRQHLMVADRAILMFRCFIPVVVVVVVVVVVLLFL